MGPFQPVPGRKFCIESEFEVKKPRFLRPEAKIEENRPDVFFNSFFFYSFFVACIPRGMRCTAAAPFGPFGTSFGRPGERNEVPKRAQEQFYGHHENIAFPHVFLGFWMSGPCHGALSGRLERLCRAT